jgi:hypothetical protein
MRGMRGMAAILAIVAVGMWAGVAGCGAKGTNRGPSPADAATYTEGKATMTVRWPERTRLIPFAANAIRVRITSGSTLLGETLLVRPTNGGLASANFDRLPLGNVTVEASAYPGSDGSGVVQASAQTVAAINANQTTNVRLTLASTIDRVEVMPATVTLSAGQTSQLTATAKNAGGEIVLTQGATMEWTSKNPTIATVEPGGLVRAVTGGTATIEAKETESGRIGTAAVTVGAVSSGNVKCDPATDHCYEKITVSGISFADARTAAAARTYQGLPGHLATITSASEQSFVQANLSPTRHVLGGYQDRSASNYREPNGGWRWVTGEAWSFTNWRGSEPNNAGNTEDYAHFFDDGTWNDATDRDCDGYLIEYESGTPGSGGGGSGGGQERFFSMMDSIMLPERVSKIKTAERVGAMRGTNMDKAIRRLLSKPTA